jgi:ABC-type polysaccharide/polyol phosphate transport system ATPase subunit
VTVIAAQALSKQFLLRHNATVELKVKFLSLLHPRHRETIEPFWALRDVSFDIAEGESVGLVGRNGSGKSTLLKLIAAIHRPTSGRLLVRRGVRISSMIELGVGFHPELTGRENVFLNAAIHGLSRSAIESIYDAVVEYSGLEHFIDVPIKNYSSGMHMRLGFAIAANMDPDILLLDEIFAVGDADFQQRCTATVERFLHSGKTIIFVSHSPDAVRSICRRVCVLDQGELLFDGGADRGLRYYAEHLARRAAESGPVIEPPVAIDEPPVADTPIEKNPRQKLADWAFEFLHAQGMRPGHYVLDIGYGDSDVAVHLLAFLEPGRYWGYDRTPGFAETAVRYFGHAANRGHFVANDTFDLNGAPQAFDFAMAGAAFAQLPLNSVARCIASVTRALSPSGRFFATWYENLHPDDFDPIARESGIQTYSDREPYHYPFSLIETVCESVGAIVERTSVAGPVAGQQVLCIRRRVGAGSAT